MSDRLRGRGDESLLVADHRLLLGRDSRHPLCPHADLIVDIRRDIRRGGDPVRLGEVFSDLLIRLFRAVRDREKSLALLVRDSPAIGGCGRSRRSTDDLRRPASTAPHWSLYGHGGGGGGGGSR